jgi:hypothetical protein
LHLINEYIKEPLSGEIAREEWPLKRVRKASQLDIQVYRNEQVVSYGRISKQQQYAGHLEPINMRANHQMRRGIIPPKPEKITKRRAPCNAHIDRHENPTSQAIRDFVAAPGPARITTMSLELAASGEPRPQPNMTSPLPLTLSD